jgi:hypothetical protein
MSETLPFLIVSEMDWREVPPNVSCTRPKLRVGSNREPVWSQTETAMVCGGGYVEA